MISSLLIKSFIKNYENTSDAKIRDKYGYLGGIIGIIVNILLFVIKFSVGTITKSIAVTADAFNNLSDVLSSVITIFGFKLSSKPADAEHPFGHGRIEYISALIVSFIVLMVGVNFAKSSFEKILNPTPVYFELIPFVLLLVSIIFKIWLSRFNLFLGKKINSSALKASAYDALNDVFASSTTVIALLAAKYISFPIDGYIGFLVSLFILYSGYNILKETLDPILGTKPDLDLVKKIEEEVLSYPNILGVHDLIIHSYGPNKIMASIHAEVPHDLSIFKIHEVIDTAEKEISNKLNILLVVHMDPVNLNCEVTKETVDFFQSIFQQYPEIISFHDFRVVGDGDSKNVLFDIVIDSEKNTEDFKESLINSINSKVKATYPNYNTIITIDVDYLGEK
ncbi:MAG: cation diffusion facilitator family transporter [Clostridiaceae bacterium]